MVDNACDCAKLISELKDTINKAAQNEIYNFIEPLISELLRNIISEEQEQLKNYLVSYLSNDIVALNNFLNYNGSLVLSYLQSITNDPFIYNFINIYFNALLLKNSINEFNELLDRAIEKCKMLSKQLSDSGLIDNYYKRLRIFRNKYSKVVNYYLQINSIANLKKIIEDMYNALCSDLTANNIPNFGIFIELQDLLSKLLLIYAQIIVLYNNIININFSVIEKINVNNVITRYLLNIIKKLLQFDNNIITYCFKLKAAINILNAVSSERNKYNQIIKLPNLNNLQNIINKMKARKDYFSFNSSNLSKSVLYLKCSALVKEKSSLIIIQSYADAILSEFSIITKSFPIIQNIVDNYQTLLNAISDFNIINNLISGNLNKIYSAQNPFVSFLNLDEIIKCLNTDIDDKIRTVADKYIDLLSESADVISNAINMLFQIESNLLKNIKLKFKINVDKMLNIVKKLNGENNKKQNYQNIEEACF